MRSLVSLRCPNLLTASTRYFRSSPVFCRYNHRMAAQEPAEEQTLLYYHQKDYYPVRPGETLQSRYRIISKLGYGAYSTVWLAWDTRSNEYTSIKVCIKVDSEQSPVLNEVRMLQRLGKHAQEADHPGLDFTRLASEIFEIDGHYCIAMKLQGASLLSLQGSFVDNKIPRMLLRGLIHRLFVSVNWLHGSCGVIHTDISPQNVLMEIKEDQPNLKSVEDEESRNPSVPIMSNGIPVYRSRVPELRLSGNPILTDFGQMRLAEPGNQDWWMSDSYRAPEVLLKLPWGFPVDIWAIGVMMLELLEGKSLFDPIDRSNDQYVLPLALAQYISYLGPPPIEMLKKSPIFSLFFDEEGNWISEAPIPKASFEDFVTTIPPGEEKDLFLRFIRRILTWDPEIRATSSEAFQDEYLMRQLF